MTFKALAKDGDSHEKDRSSISVMFLSDSDISLGDVTPQIRWLKSAWSKLRVCDCPPAVVLYSCICIAESCKQLTYSALRLTKVPTVELLLCLVAGLNLRIWIICLIRNGLHSRIRLFLSWKCCFPQHLFVRIRRSRPMRAQYWDFFLHNFTAYDSRILRRCRPGCFFGSIL